MPFLLRATSNATLQVLRNIGGGVAKKMIDQPGVYEVAFWDPTVTEKLARTSRVPSCPDFVDVVDNYTLLHQGLIVHAFLEEIEARRTMLPDAQPTPPNGIFSPYLLRNCRTLPADAFDALSGTHPIDHVRRCIAGGEVGDGNFPDIKYKCLIHSKSEGSIMIIPREANLRAAATPPDTHACFHDDDSHATLTKPPPGMVPAVRFYVQLQTSEGGKVVSIASDKATQDICIARAKKIFEPFELEFGHVDWFSVYQIGQRIASQYTLDHRNFLGGDATRTHSPQAGHGMNISMLDMYSLAWKLNLVMKGHGKPEILLPSYEHERRGVAEELLKFDGAQAPLERRYTPFRVIFKVCVKCSRGRSGSASSSEEGIRLLGGEAVRLRAQASLACAPGTPAAVCLIPSLQSRRYPTQARHSRTRGSPRIGARDVSAAIDPAAHGHRRLVARVEPRPRSRSLPCVSGRAHDSEAGVCVRETLRVLHAASLAQPARPRGAGVALGAASWVRAAGGKIKSRARARASTEPYLPPYPVTYSHAQFLTDRAIPPYHDPCNIKYEEDEFL
ncbi:FAD binding domain-containing protein [Mycena latifolia]|nr:FAD binding domain-containing protein [Mycena latifolia]